MTVGALVEQLIWVADNLDNSNRELIEEACNILDRLPRTEETEIAKAKLENVFNTNIKDAIYISVWETNDGTNLKFTCPCKVNMKTKKVLDLTFEESCDMLIGEYICIDGVNFKVAPEEDSDKAYEFHY